MTDASVNAGAGGTRDGIGDGRTQLLAGMAAERSTPRHKRSATTRRPRRIGLARASGCEAPVVPVAKPSKARSSDDLGGWMRLRLHGSHRGRILLQGQARSVVEAIRGDASERALEVFFVEDDDVVEEIAACGADEALSDSVLQGLRAVICLGSMRMWWIVEMTSLPYLASPSRIRQRGAWP
jgi:hypothetical protein